jgi:hypothetical protein
MARTAACLTHAALKFGIEVEAKPNAFIAAPIGPNLVTSTEHDVAPALRV